MSSRFSRAPGPQNNSILSTLRAAEMIDSKAALPAEIIATILDYLPVPDLLRFARTSSRMREMVYDDTRWVARLKAMGVWNEAEARRRFEDAMRRRKEAQERDARERRAAAAAAAAAGAAGAPRAPGVHPSNRQSMAPPTTTLFFDAEKEEEEEERQQRRASVVPQPVAGPGRLPSRGSVVTTELRDGFETLAVAGGSTGAPQQQQQQQQTSPPAAPKDPLKDSAALLDVLQHARSVRGRAREEYGKIYGALAPFYYDLVRAKSHADPAIFKVFRAPESQARMLANLHVFGRSDGTPGWAQREEKLTRMSNIFESAVLREFEQGYEVWDVEGRMRRYAHVLDTLNSTAGEDLFVHKHPLFSDREVVADPLECLDQSSSDAITLEPSRQFFEVLARKLNEQSEIIHKVFPKAGKVFWAFADKAREDIVMDYATSLFDEARERSVECYLRAVSGIFEQCLQFHRSLNVGGCSKEENEGKAKEQAHRVAEPHLDLYLQDELEFFQKKAEGEVASWERKLSEQDATQELFYMASFTRQVEKKDFLTSFKNAVMMPVTVLPTLPGQLLSSPFGLTRTASATNGMGAPSSRPSTPGGSTLDKRSTAPSKTTPADELAAKAALMASKLEGIKSLFSIEVALHLVHLAKTSLGRAAVFISLGGQVGGEAREQCAQIFISLLRTLGSRHIKPGFDKAVDHLATYKAREVTDHSAQGGVAPLVQFIELVNVGDLISQMIDVFYDQQLATPKIADRDDFLDPSAMAKKKFEQMLDESVAAGLAKGIDVLMDEVEYICATTQLPTDFNPAGPDPAGAGAGAGAGADAGAGAGGAPGAADKRASVASFASYGAQKPAAYAADLGATATARRVVAMVERHTRGLVGATEKSMLEVFNGEVGRRLFEAVCSHLKRQRVSPEGALKLTADMSLYYRFAVETLKNKDLEPYFTALKTLSTIYLIAPQDEKDMPRFARQMAEMIADEKKSFDGVFRAEDVKKFAARRADWYQVKGYVETAIDGKCCVM